MNHGGIYAIWHKSKDNLFYVGSSLKSIRKRWSCHRLKLRNNKHKNPILQNIVNKYGIDGLCIKVLLKRSNLSVEELSDLEDDYIINFKNKYGKVINIYLNSNLNIKAVRNAKSISERMKSDNPMKNKKVVKRAMDTRKRNYPANKVHQYSLKGKLIRIWDSSTEASKALNVDNSNISRACNSNRKCANSIWIYEKDFSEELLFNKKSKIKFPKPQKNKHKIKYDILQINPLTKEIIKFSGTRDAERKTGISSAGISASATKRAVSESGFIWIYERDFTDKILEERLKNFWNTWGYENNKYIRLNKPAYKKIHQIDIKSKKIINTFESVKSASRHLQVYPSNISKAATGEVKSCAGYIWIYVSDFNNDVLEERIKLATTRKAKK